MAAENEFQSQQIPAAGALGLGWGSVCLGVQELPASLEFYRKLGFTVCGGQPEHGYAVLDNAGTGIGLFAGMFEGALLNFRGIDVPALATQLRGRGFEPQNYTKYDPAQYPPEWAQDSAGNPLPLDGSGSFILSDPDGTAILFDTVPAERATYRSGRRFNSDQVTGELLEGQQPLGRLDYCINAADLAASVEFYTRLGLRLERHNPDEGWALLVNSAPSRFAVAVFQGHIERNCLNFRGGDVFAIAERLKSAGLAFTRGPETESDGSAGLWLDDPDGYAIYFNTAPGEEQA